MQCFGHRGAAGEAPENTVAGFLYARSRGVRAFEFDVHRTADNELAVIHDDRLDRTTNATGAVYSYTAEQLAGLDARAEFPEWPVRVGVPTLEEVLAVVPGCQLQIEIKSDTADNLEMVCGRLAVILRDEELASRTVVSSFDEQALANMQRLAPAIPRSLIARFATMQELERAAELACCWICPHLPSTSKALVHAAQNSGMKVCAWMGNTPEELATLVAWGVEAVTTDYPSIALAYLCEHGILEL